MNINKILTFQKLEDNLYEYLLIDSYDVNAANKYIKLHNQDEPKKFLWSDLDNLDDASILNENYNRVYLIVRSYTNNRSKYYNDPDIYKMLMYDMLFLSQYYNKDAEQKGNWWYWNIGIPWLYSQIMVLVDQHHRIDFDSVDLYNEVLESYRGIIERFVKKKVTRGDLTYANKASICKNLFVAGILLDNDKYINTALNEAISAFEPINKTRVLTAQALQRFYVNHPKLPYTISMFAGKEGIYPDDCTFIQHSSIPYIGTYGVEMIQFAALVLESIKGTDVSLPNSIKTNLTYWLFAYDASIYRDEMMLMYCGRAIQEVNPQGIASQLKRYINEINECLHTESVPKNNICMIQHNSDKCIYDYADWRFAISMCSDRTAKYESFNNQNADGWYQNLGMTYLYTPNVTYKDYFKRVDPCWLPGVTCFSDRKEIKESKQPRFNYTKKDMELLRAGGCRLVGQERLSAMMQVNDDDLFARKSWFMFDNKVLCLGSRISIGAHTTIVNKFDVKEGDWRWTDADHDELYIKDFGTIKTRDRLDIQQEQDNLIVYRDHTYSRSYEYLIYPDVEFIGDDPSKIDYLAFADVHCAYYSTPSVYYWKDTYFFNFWEESEMIFHDVHIRTDCPAAIIIDKDEKGMSLHVSDYTQHLSSQTLYIEGEYELGFKHDSVKLGKKKINGHIYTVLKLNCKNRLGKAIIINLKNK